jgi:hypothetical protein
MIDYQTSKHPYLRIYNIINSFFLISFCQNRGAPWVDPKDGLMDDMLNVAGVRWMRVAQDRPLWHSLGEAYVHQYTFFS